MNKISNKQHKQQGATLITALMMLLVLTILGISAVKMTTLNILVAGNEQQKMMLFQTAETDLVNMTTPVKLYTPLVDKLFDQDTGEYLVPNPTNPLSAETITDTGKIYSCEGISGLAVSLGPDMPPCQMYDFQIRARAANRGARDTHHRGAGKEVPNPKKNSYL